MSKKLIALLMAFLLTLTVCAVAFADGADGDDTGTTVTNENEDPTNPEGEDPTNPAGEDPTNPAGEDPTDPAGEDPTDPAGEDPTEPDNPEVPEGAYDYTKDESLSAVTDMANGEFGFGLMSSCMYNIIEGKAYTLADAEEKEMIDDIGITLPTRESESITVSAYYAFNCPACGKANGGVSLFTLYDTNKGKCIHCGQYLPAPKDVKVYRFLMVDFDSVHFDTFSGMNFTKKCKDIFGPTADQYGDGKDLSFNCLTFETETHMEEDKEVTEIIYDRLDSFKTSGGGSTFKALMWDFLTKFANVHEKRINSKVTITIYTAMAEATIKFVEFMGAALRFIPSLIF